MNVCFLADDRLSTPSSRRGATIADIKAACPAGTDPTTALGELVIDRHEIVQHVMQDGAPLEREEPFRFVLNPEIKKHYERLCHQYGYALPTKGNLQPSPYVPSSAPPEPTEPIAQTDAPAPDRGNETTGRPAARKTTPTPPPVFNNP